MQLLTLGQYRCAHDNSQKLTIGQQNSRWKNYLDIRPITVNFSFIVGHSHHKIIYQNAPWMLTIWLTTKTKNHWHVFVKKTFKKNWKTTRQKYNITIQYNIFDICFKIVILIPSMVLQVSKKYVMLTTFL